MESFEIRCDVGGVIDDEWGGDQINDLVTVYQTAERGCLITSVASQIFLVKSSEDLSTIDFLSKTIS